MNYQVAQRTLCDFFVIPMSQVNANACMKAFIWRMVITEMKQSEIEVIPKGYRVGGTHIRVGVQPTKRSPTRTSHLKRK